jgi:hypothetical protein
LFWSLRRMCLGHPVQGRPLRKFMSWRGLLQAEAISSRCVNSLSIQYTVKRGLLRPRPSCFGIRSSLPFSVAAMLQQLYTRWDFFGACGACVSDSSGYPAPRWHERRFVRDRGRSSSGWRDRAAAGRRGHAAAGARPQLAPAPACAAFSFVLLLPWRPLHESCLVKNPSPQPGRA